MTGVVVALVLVLVAAACGDSGESAAAGDFPRLTGRDVIAATRAAQTAHVMIEEHASVADPGTAHGTSGAEEENQTSEGEFDFEHNRSVLRWEFPPFDLGDGADTGPTKVEARAIDDTAYVRDGSWLCPGCGMDDDEPLPSDKWITVPVSSGDKAFDFSQDAFYGRLGWMELVKDPAAPARRNTRDGVTVGVYEVTIPVATAQAALPRGDEGEDMSDLQLQGTSVTIRFEVDADKRLRHLAVEYKMDDRSRTFTATLDRFGKPVAIEKPPDDEIFKE